MFKILINSLIKDNFPDEDLTSLQKSVKVLQIKPNRSTIIPIVVVVVLLSLIVTVIRANAYQVPPLPAGNLVNNPWFRSTSDPNYSSLDGWTDVAGKDKYWSTSQKESNPSPEIIVNGICNNKPVYCGTSARLKNAPGQTGGIGVPGVDSYLTQVVAANKDNKHLFFFTYWVSHKIDPAEVTIFGSNSSKGPWDFVWTPFYHVQDVADGEFYQWTDTGMLEKNIDDGYSFYKIEIHARLPDDIPVGFKITGIYFTALGPGSSVPPGADKMSYLPLVLNERSK